MLAKSDEIIAVRVEYFDSKVDSVIRLVLSYYPLLGQNALKQLNADRISNV